MFYYEDFARLNNSLNRNRKKKLLRDCIKSFCSEFLKLGTKIFLRIVAQPIIVAIFSKIKENIISRNQSSHNFYVSFNKGIK